MRATFPFAPRSLFALAAVPLALALAGCDGGDTSSSSSTAGAAGTAGTAGSAGNSGAAGMGGSGGSGGTATTGGTGGFVTAAHPPFPELTGTPGGIIANGKLISVVFSDDPNAAKIFDMGDALVDSQWLTDVGAEYGVGPGTHIAKIKLPEPTPAKLSETALYNLIDTHIKDGTLPPITPDAMYMIYIPATTAFTDADGFQICTDYLGYHYQTSIPSGTLTYAIVGDCGGGFGEVSATFAHEYIEMATDPGPTGGYYLQLGLNDPWITLQYQECADLCDYADYVTVGGYTFQRSWSNAAAKAAMGSPCAPVDANEVFYDVSAEPNNVVAVPAGQSTTFTLTGWSTAPMADWDLHYDASYYGDFTPKVDLSATKINNGTTVTVTLTVPAGTPKGRLGTAMIYSGASYSRFWPVTVRSM